MSTWLIVGAGLSGATIARQLADAGERILVVDQRGHVAGNAHDPVHSSGVRIHAHGPHAFHTNSDKVVAFLSRFTEWHPYEHRVLGRVDGQVIPIPFNETGLETFFPDEAERLLATIRKHYGQVDNVTIAKLIESSVPIVRDFAQFVFDRVFVGYTRKQWGMEPAALGPQVMSRVPVRLTRDDRYFQDRFQAIPVDGYTAMVARMLDHPRINLELGRRSSLDEMLRFERVVYTGALDEALGAIYGHLPYRSLRFVFDVRDTDFELATAQMNFPQEHAYTRISEFKHMTGQVIDRTVTATEYPQGHEPGVNTPYYPVDTPVSRAQHKKYLQRFQSVHPGLIALGRLADFRYYNMDQAVAKALKVSSDLTK